MAEFIERKALLREMRNEYRECRKHGEENGGEAILLAEGVSSAIDTVKYFPAADVVPVVHGRWVGRPLCGDDNCRCSVCGFWTNVHANLSGKITQKYCPNCGAKMDGEKSG